LIGRGPRHGAAEVALADAVRRSRAEQGRARRAEAEQQAATPEAPAEDARGKAAQA
jgi:hypothetical protein